VSEIWKHPLVESFKLFILREVPQGAAATPFSRRVQLQRRYRGITTLSEIPSKSLSHYYDDNVTTLKGKAFHKLNVFQQIP
jgi:hypothetical protein